MSAMPMQDRVVLVTGASRGIGAATARLFAQRGAKVVVNYHQSAESAQALVAEIEANGGRALALQANVGDMQQVEAMVRRTEEELGPIDTLVMNAAAVHNFVFAPFLEFQWDVFQDMVIGELAGVYIPARVVAPLMVERKRGNLIAISSSLSRTPFEGTSAHAAGKSGVDALVKVLARELGPHGIRVNAIAPGFTETDATSWNNERKQMISRMAPLRRIAQPEDIAGAIYLLASDEAGFITGNYVAVGGGMYMQ